jgi:hypothetical protein
MKSRFLGGLFILACLLGYGRLEAGHMTFPTGRHRGIFVSNAAGGGGAVSSFAVENLSNGISSGTVTSATTTITTTANTTLVVLVSAWRRSGSQSATATTFGGTSMTTSTQTVSDQMRIRISYILSPGAGTFPIALTLSASTPGFAMRAISFTGSTVAPLNELQNTGSVTTSTLTFVSQSGDLILTGMTKQDASTSEPVLNTANSTIWYDTDFNSGGGSNGGHFKIAITSATGVSTPVNYSWPTAANHGIAGCGLR